MERVILITILLVFLAGYAFCAWGVPFLDNVSNTLTVWFQKIQGRMAVKITEDSVKASKLKKSLKEETGEKSRAIGFFIQDDEVEEEEEYDDD